MHNFATWIVWIYILLLLIGGLIGFYRGKSKASLITSAVFAALLALTTLPGVFQPGFALGLPNTAMAALLVVFAIRLAQNKKFMPSGLMLVVTALALALQNLRFK
jgi:uncharacterized membrane protein (UPF0136 family)